MTPESAEEYTQALGQVFGGGWRLVLHAQREGVPQALGLSTEEWVNQRLGGYMRLTVEERREAAKELTEGEGLTQREAAEVLGVGLGTVNRSLESEPVPSGTDDLDDEPVDLDELPEPVPNGTDDLDDEPEPEVEPVSESAGARRNAANSGDNEWYTPAEYIKAAVAVMGMVDLDPASSEEANEVVGAARFYAPEDDGLTQPWSGRVWMNPPYAQPLVDRFCTRLAREIKEGSVTQACLLINNATETNYWQEAAGEASAICFPRGRVKFWHPRKEAIPLQGQCVIYFGPNVAAFRAEFSRFGRVASFLKGDF